ncbi:HK97 family phage prohead protease [Azospirillum sp. TSH58]|uniref:HK97 family phage prohead protease n=1 Tax=Azospirillum sp. TSH58 TaxID=664962 RepID=UPI001FFEB3DA|nr:HK97 family phage prohead protease [Azospirillum sp. TSH58]
MTTPNNDPASAVSTRAGSLAPSTFNADRREVEVTASSGADVRRVGMRPDATWGAWRERLDVAGVDLSRFTGASVLRDHRPSTDAVVGSVLSARKSGGELRAMLTFDTTDAGELAFQQVQQGSIRQVSLGYFVQEWAAGPSDDIAEPLFIARRWQPVEISIVAIGADPAARTRSVEGITMTTQTTPAPQHQPAPATDSRAELLDHILSRATCPQLALPPDMVQRAAADPSMTIQRFNEMVVDHVAAQPSNQRNINPHIQMYDSHDDPVTTRAFMAEALAARLAPGLVKPGDRAREYMGCSAMGMVGELLAARGENVNRLNHKEMMKRVHTTSDFPLLLESAANKVLLAQYAAAAPTYRLWAARRGFNDFKPAKFLRVGDFRASSPWPRLAS